ncbi:unnamed protein product [Scytosiphon promiscuus]
MEEADARLQEVVASLLNEHGGNHEQALRQTFACLHNSGLYEAQSAAEEEQREQQVLAVFRSFPFRTPTAPGGNGGGNLVEETQAPPPPAYNTLVREPEEAGEVTPVQADPENVGEDASAHPAPEALLPLHPDDPQEADQQAEAAAPGPELSNQGSAPPQANLAVGSTPVGGDAVSSQQGIPPTPEEPALAVGLEAGDGAASAPAPAPAPAGAGSPAAAGGGVEETKGEDVGGVGFPESREAGAGAPAAGGLRVAESTAQASGPPVEEGGREERENGVVVANGAEAAGSEPHTHGVGGPTAGDPESTLLQESAPARGDELPHQAGPREPAAGEPSANGGGGEPPQSLAAAGGAAAEEGEMDAGAGPTSGADGGAAAAAPDAAARTPATTAVTEPHLKTAGQPLTHGNRAESPTGMSTDLQDKLKALKLRRKHRFVTMRIEGTEVVAETLGAPGEGPAQLKVALPYSDCRYAVYDQEIVTADGRKANKLFFFTWLPHNATPHNKMAYSHGKVTVRQRLEGLYDVAASSFEDVEVALGLVDEDEEDSDIDF